MQLIDFDYHLPDPQIAYYPSTLRTQSRLLCLQAGGAYVDRSFTAVLDLIEPGDLLVLNDTKVIPARLFGVKATGGKIELLVERVLDQQHLLAQIHASKPPRMGSELFFADGVRLRVVERKQKFYRLQLEDTSQTILDIIERLGEIPLPPYIKRAAEASDKERYQTVYARYKGSVAAPTAGLHFDENLLQRLSEKNVNLGYLTLHIGAGTFTPVHASDIQAHQMHAETISVSEGLCQQIQQTKANGKRVIAVGTTTLRALETVASRGSLQAYTGDTSIFITPGHRFNSADVLITNLHLPKSTLLMLVCAFGGYRSVMRAYHHAVDAQYRFYSYGDAMWIPLAAADGIATDSTT